MSFYKYINKVKGDFKQAIKVEWLNPDESVNFEFTDALYDIGVDVNVNYQNGSRRSCTLTLNNDRNRFPINFNNIWIGQKFKLWMGIYLDDETPYYLPQGVFYVSNPDETYNPSTRTVTINGVDKWSYLDGTLHGKLTGTYKTNIGVNLYDATRELLKMPLLPINRFFLTGGDNGNIEEYFEIQNGTNYFKWENNKFSSDNDKRNTTAYTVLKAKKHMDVAFDYSYNLVFKGCFKLSINDYVYENIEVTKGATTIEKSQKYFGRISKGDEIRFELTWGDWTYESSASFSNINVTTYMPVDPTPPLLSGYYLNKTSTVNNEEKSVLECPYTATSERGSTYADILLEYATILCANIYYDVNGRLVIEPIIDTADDITDTNKEILWDYTVDEKTFLGLTQTYNFDRVYNDFIVLGNILNGYQFKGRVQNRNPMSNTSVQRIGLKTKEPIEDNQYISDEQCVELAKYYAKTDTILQKSGTISSIPLFHLDVNKLVTVSTPNNNMSKELFLISGFSLSTSGSMNVNITSVNILKDFSVVEGAVNE